MATEALTKQFRDLINDCSQSPVDEPLINSDWGKINFESFRPELERTYSMLNQFMFAPASMCSWVFLRMPPDCTGQPSSPFHAIFHSLLAIPRSDLAP